MVHQNIEEFGGGDNRIFVAGHGTGAGLPAHITTDNSWLAEAKLPANLIKRAVLLAGPMDLFKPPRAPLKLSVPATQMQPMLVAYGTIDGESPVKDQETLVNNLLAANLDVRAVRLELMDQLSVESSFGDQYGCVLPNVMSLIEGTDQPVFAAVNTVKLAKPSENKRALG